MKIIFVFFICYFVGALAGDSSKKEDQRRENAMTECRMEMKDSSNLGCVYECMHKKVGYLHANGSLNIVRITDGDRNPAFREVVQKVHQTCVDKSDGDSCKVSLCLEVTKCC